MEHSRMSRAQHRGSSIMGVEGEVTKEYKQKHKWSGEHSVEGENSIEKVDGAATKILIGTAAINIHHMRTEGRGRRYPSPCSSKRPWGVSSWGTSHVNYFFIK